MTISIEGVGGKLKKLGLFSVRGKGKEEKKNIRGKNMSEAHKKGLKHLKPAVNRTCSIVEGFACDKAPRKRGKR